MTDTATKPVTGFQHVVADFVGFGGTLVAFLAANSAVGGPVIHVGAGEQAAIVAVTAAIATLATRVHSYFTGGSV